MTLKNTYKDLYEKGKELVPDNFADLPNPLTRRKRDQKTL